VATVTSEPDDVEHGVRGAIKPCQWYPALVLQSEVMSALMAELLGGPLPFYTGDLGYESTATTVGLINSAVDRGSAMDAQQSASAFDFVYLKDALLYIMQHTPGESMRPSANGGTLHASSSCF
jgi:hypothetical protein